MAAYKNAALRRLMTTAATHDIDPDGWFPVHAVVNTFQPMIKPSQMERHQIEGSVVSELSLSGVAVVLTAMNPWSDDQPLQALRCFSQLNEI